MGHNSHADHTAERNASYWINRTGQRGMRLVAQRDIWYDGRTTKQGDIVTLLTASNAGFNGMTVLATDSNGDYIQASAGAFAPQRS